MAAVLWVVVALAAASGVCLFAVRRAQRRLPPIVLPPGETLPRTPLQQLAFWSLAAVLALSLAAAGIIVAFGVEAWWERDAIRLTATALLVAALAAFAFYAARVGLWSAREDAAFDERDRAILASASAGQAPAMLVTLAAWMIGLVETHQQTDLVPSAFLYLIFWSCLMVSVVALLAGVLLGYQRQ